ncbi:MAG: hypothetical protein RLZZ127_473 [Planctomycetota bacterium]|jgi:uncharacterized RDD family membrane protein YckC
MANRWFVTLDGREVGPLDPPQVKELVAQGRIRHDTPIRRDDLARPVAAGTVKGLLPPADEASTVAVRQRDTVSSQPTVRALRPVPVDQRATGEGLLEVATADPRTTEMAPVPGPRATEPAGIIYGEPAATPEPAPRPAPRPARGRPAAPVPAEDEIEVIDEAEPAEPADGRASFPVRLGAWAIDVAVIGVVTGILWILAFMYLIGGTAAALQDEQLRRDTIAAKAGFPIPALGELEALRPELQGRIDEAKAKEAAAKAALEAAKPPPDAAGKRPKPPDLSQEEYRVTLAQNEVKEAEDRLRFLENVENNGQAAVEAKVKGKARFGGLLLLMASALSFLAIPIQEGAFGTTLGKRLLGWRVAGMTGRPVGLGKAILRHLVRLIPFGQFAALGAERQALHDSLTGTQVIPRSVPPPRTGKLRKAAPGTAPAGRPVTGSFAKPGAGIGTRPTRRR